MKLRHLTTSAKVIGIFAVLSLLAWLLPVRKSSIDASGVLSAASIFYTILIGFYIAGAMGNLSRLKTLIAAETGGLIALYHIVRVALPDRLDTFRATVDRYLIKRFEYEIDAYTEPTTAEFFEIFSVLRDAKPAGEGEAAAMEYIAEGFYYLPQARREVTIVGARIVTAVSWLILSLLCFIIVASLYLGRQAGFDSDLITVLLSASAIIVLIVLDDVDSNRFGEEQFAIDTYQDVLRAMGLLPYYSARYLELHGYVPPEQIYRTGHYGEVKEVDKRTRKEKS